MGDLKGEGDRFALIIVKRIGLAFIDFKNLLLVVGDKYLVPGEPLVSTVLCILELVAEEPAYGVRLALKVNFLLGDRFLGYYAS